MSPAPIEVRQERVERLDVIALLREHLDDMHATSPPGSIHALDLDGLRAASVTFVTARRADVLLGCGALKQLDSSHVEVKSMRTTTSARGSGVASLVLQWLLEHARRLGAERASLETGTQDYFAPAHRLYLRHGFESSGPFGDYCRDSHSAYFTRDLRG